MKNTLMNYIKISSIIFSHILIPLSLNAQTVPSYVPTNGLVAWWPFNGNAIDESSNNNNGIVNGPILIADRDGNNNSAFLWNSSPDKIIVLSNPQTQLTVSFTISVWINPNSGTYGTGPNYHAIIEKWGSSGDASYLMGLRPNGVPFFNTHDGPSTTGLDASQSIPQNSWSNIVFTLNNDSGHLYINGVLDTMRTGMVTPLVMNNDLILGSNDSYNTGWAGDAYEGIIDDIGMWNRALAPNEVLGLYQSGISLNNACDTLYYSTTNNTWFGQTIKSSDGNIVSVGTENHLYNWSNGDIFLNKYDTSFNLIWSRKFYVGGGMDVAGGVLATSDGGYLINGAFGNSNPAGSFSAGYIIKTDSSGNQQWVQTLTGQSYGDNYSSQAVENSLGEFICYGYVQHHSGCSSYATRITKLSSTGSIVWSNCIQLNPDWTGGITKLTSSDIYISAFNNANNGTIELRKWDDSGIQIGLTSYQYNNQQFSVGAVRSCYTGGYFVFGRYNSSGSQKNAFVAKFDDSMNFLWEASDSTYIENHFYTLAEDNQGNLFCTGIINDISQPGDLFVTQFNSSGIFQNKGIFGSPTSNELAQGIVTLSNGDIICSGRSDSQGLLIKFCGLGSITTGMAENLQHQNPLTLFPNPTSDFLHLTFYANNLKPIKISIYNLSGQRVYDKIFETSFLGPQQLSVALEDYQNGLYYIRLESSEIMLSQKFMIVR